MSEDLRIRKYRPADRDRVEAVMERALRDAGAYLEGAPDDEAPIEAACRGGEFLVGTVDGEIVATGAFRRPAEPLTEFVDPGESAAELKRMHVHPAYQRRGYGERLLEELQARARREYAALVLLTSDRQTAAQQFYEANGFAEVRREPVAAFGEEFAVVVYRKRLAGGE